MAASQNGVPGDRAAPLVGLVIKFDLVTAPILLLLTMGQTAWDLGAKYDQVTQGPAQVECLIIFSLNRYAWSSKAREDKGVRELFPHIGPIPILIPLKLFLEGIESPRIILPRALRGSFVEEESIN